MSQSQQNLSDKATKKFKATMCGIAFNDEAGRTDVTLYPDHKTCTCGDPHCGVALVEVELRFEKWIKKPRPF